MARWLEDVEDALGHVCRIGFALIRLGCSNLREPEFD